MSVFFNLGIFRLSRAEPPFSPGTHVSVEPKIGVFPPKRMVKIMENPIKNGWFGGKTHHLRKTPMWNFQGFPRPLIVSIPRSSIGVDCSVASMTSPTAALIQRRSRDWVGWHHHWSCGLHEKANDGACDGVSWDTEKKTWCFLFLVWEEGEGLFVFTICCRVFVGDVSQKFVSCIFPMIRVSNYSYVFWVFM